MIYIIFIAVAIASFMAQQSLKSKFERFSRIPLRRPMTGSDVARQMLWDHSIRDVQVSATRGTLTDFFNPLNRSVNLSEGVYASNSIAAAAVAAHECGHAVQHARGYAPLKLRTRLVPVVNFASQWVSWLLLAGIILIQSFPVIFEMGVLFFACTTLFSFITLPVEIDASRRAIQWIDTAGITQGETTVMAKSALRSAAYTYVVAALGSLATLVYYALILLGHRD